MPRPYLTPELDERYQLLETKNGCRGLFGKTVYRGQMAGYTLTFRHIGFRPTGQAEGGPAIEISVTLSREYLPLMREIVVGKWGYLAKWLRDLPQPRMDLLERQHNYSEFWEIKKTTLSVTMVWERWENDLSVVPDCVTRLLAIAELIKSQASL